MFFDFLLNVKEPVKTGKPFGDMKQLHQMCCSAEYNSRINPDLCMLNIRQAIETLIKGLLKDDGYCMDKGDSLNDLINKCLERGLITVANREKFDKLRRKSNRIVHANQGGAGNPQSAGVNANVKDACYHTVGLFIELSKIFSYRGKEIRGEDLPIGDYEVIKKIPAQKYESVEGNFNFICKKQGADIETYVYIRPFKADENNARNVFNERDLQVQNFFSNMRGSGAVIRGHEIQTSDSCDLRYLAYEIKQNTRTLNMLKEPLGAYEAADIVSQVTEGLMALSTKKINIHHRGIRPSCIFINKYEEEYEAKIGCFETSKIEYVERDMRTVRSYMVKAQKDNPFVHPELIGKETATDEEWESGDVYSLAAILLYCLDKESVQFGNMDCSCLLDHYSDSFYETFLQILTAGSLEVVPDLTQFYALLEAEKRDLR